MNDYMLNQFQALELFIKEAGHENGEISAQVAQRALGVLRDEVDRAIDLQVALNIVEQEIIEPIDLDTSALLQYVTHIPMKSKGVYIQSFQGRQLHLLAHPPKCTNVDEMILFGSGIDEPLGIMPGPAMITIDKISFDLSIHDLACMLGHLSPVGHARWIVNSRVIPLMVSFRANKGHKFFTKEPASILGFPVVQVDSQMCDRYGFEVALVDLRYYVWGEYETDGGLLVDVCPVLVNHFMEKTAQDIQVPSSCWERQIMTDPTGGLLQTETGYRWTGGPVIRTTYAMLLYGLPDVDAKPPLSPGCPVRIGPYRLRVLREEPDTATVLLIRERGLMLGWRLRQVVLRAALALGRWAEMEGTG